MIINLYTLNKRENSTLRPSGSGHSFECYLKAPTSIIDPVIVIDFGDAADPQAHYFNYAYIPDYSRYYFISDIRSVGKLWEFSLSTDILATYKDTIGAANAYIQRSSHSFNGDIMDTTYPIKADFTIDKRSSVTIGDITRKASPWTYIISGGTFVFGLASKTGGFGSIKYVAMNPANAALFVQTLSDTAISQANGFGDIIDQVGQAFVKQFVDPLQFVKDCKFVPIPYSDISVAEDTTIETGYLNFTGFSYKDITSASWMGNFVAFELQDHPQASRGIYLNAEPFTERFLYAPPFGMVPLPSKNIIDVNYLVVNYRVDFISGLGTLSIYASDAPNTLSPNLTDNMLLEIHSPVCVPIQLTQSNVDFLGSFTNIAGAAVNAFTENWFVIPSQVTNAISAMKPRLSMIGGSGGLAQLSGPWYIYSIFAKITDEDLSHHGRPLFENHIISTIPGYIQCDGDVPISGTSGEQQQLKSYLEGGFYYE